MKFACCKSTTEGATGMMTCSSCKNNYHIACMYPTDKKKILPDLKTKWVCPECRLSKPRQYNNDNTPLRKNDRGSPENVTMRRGDSYKSPECSMEASIAYEQVREIVSLEFEKFCSKLKTTIADIISTELMPIRKEIASFQDSIAFINEQYENLNKKIEFIENDLKTLKATNKEIGEIKSDLNRFEQEHNNREQWSRRSNIEIYGIPEKKGENLIDILKSIAQRMDFPLNINYDLDFITRVAPKNNTSKKPKPIVVRFLARYRKDDFLSKARKLKLKASDLGFNNNNSPIFFNDHLTSENKSLLQRVKTKARENKYLYIWVKNCAIMVRRTDTSPIIHISNETDLNKIK